jgi:hypothetical protein
MDAPTLISTLDANLYNKIIYYDEYGLPCTPHTITEVFIPFHQVVINSDSGCYKSNRPRLNSLDNLITIKFPADLAKKIKVIANLYLEYEQKKINMRPGEYDSFVEFNFKKEELKPELDKFWKKHGVETASSSEDKKDGPCTLL